MFGIIYKATNLINQKCYIGQTITNLQKRINNHIKKSKQPLSLDDSIFKRAIKKYKPENFKWEILCECESQFELDEMEFHYIKQFNSYFKNNCGYNMTWGGGGPGLMARRGHHLSEDHKKKIGNANKGEKNGMHKSNGRINPMQGRCGELAPNWGNRGEKNQFSKKYKVITPIGEELIIIGMSNFCKENNLNKGAMCNNAKLNNGRKHKGYQCFLIP